MMLKDINNYINSNILISDDYKKNLEALNLIIVFLNKEEKALSPEILIELIKSNIMVQELLKTITPNKIEKEDFNDDILLMIEVYCSLNDINYELNNNKFDVKNEYVSDDLKSYLNEISKIPLLTPQEEQLLFIKLKEGDTKVKKEIIERNLRLVVSIAKKYVRPGIVLLDLIQEGNMGLMKAVDKYDANKGYKFSTYATWWILQSVSKTMHETRRNIRLPIHTSEKVDKLKRIENELSLEYCREPTIKELSLKAGLSIEKVKQLQSFYNDTASIDTYIDEEEKTEFSKMIPADDTCIDDIAINNIMRYELIKILETVLTKKEAEVIKLRYGFYDEENKSLDSIGKIFGISRQRVAQIEKEALKKLKKSKKLLSYVDITEKPNNSLIQKKNEIKKETISIKKEGKKQTTTGGFNSIYDFFDSYTKEEVDLMISKLDYNERKVLKLKWGNNYDEQTDLKMFKKYLEFYYKVLVPKMKKILLEIHNRKVNYIDVEQKGNSKNLRYRKK